MIQNLKLLRAERGISQQQLANVIGVSQQSINKYENHDVEPDISTLIAIADYFDTSVDYLIGRFDKQELLKSELTIKESTLLKGYRKLDGKEKICVDTLIDTYNNIRK